MCIAPRGRVTLRKMQKVSCQQVGRSPPRLAHAPSSTMLAAAHPQLAAAGGAARLRASPLAAAAPAQALTAARRVAAPRRAALRPQARAPASYTPIAAATALCRHSGRPAAPHGPQAAASPFRPVSLS